jgi:hypothetical protein
LERLLVVFSWPKIHPHGGKERLNDGPGKPGLNCRLGKSVNDQVGGKLGPKGFVDFIFLLIKSEARFDVATFGSSVAGCAIDDFVGNSNQSVDVSHVLANFRGQ